MHYLNSLAAFLRFKKNFIGVSALLLACLGVPAVAQSYHHEVETGDKTSVSVKSRNGRVSVIATDDQLKKVSIEASSAGALVDQTDVLTVTKGGDVNITVRDRRDKDRIDLVVRVPVRTKVKVESEAGAVDVVGNLESAEVSTNTGTIHADVPLDAVKFNFLWTASRPRFLSDVELPKIKEKAAGAFAISGKLPDKKSDKEEKSDKDEESDRDKDSDKNKESDKDKKKAEKDQRIHLEFLTQRGVILLNVDPAIVPPDLRERPLTAAARAIVRSGDSQLTDAIRKV